MTNRHTLTFTAGPQHIDAMGHVNNTVWVRWMEEIAAAYAWVVTRHEINYRGNIREGETVTAETFIDTGPSGARFDRRVDFRVIGEGGAEGKVIVSARTTWAMIDLATQRLCRVPAEVAAPFAPEGGWKG